MGNNGPTLDLSKFTSKIKNNLDKSNNENPEAEPVKETVVVRDQPSKVGEEAPKRPGRKKSEYTIPRTNAKTIYIDDETNERLFIAKAKDKVDFKDLILVATIDYLNRNLDQYGRLLPKALKQIEDEIARIIESGKENQKK